VRAWNGGRYPNWKTNRNNVLASFAPRWCEKAKQKPPIGVILNLVPPEEFESSFWP
jgi:hypothetical protein